MWRDTYHDYVTALELLNSGRPAAGYLDTVRRILMERSGACSVANAVVTTHERPETMVVEMVVSFDSSAWTGR